jgi:hypothetical protein
MRPLCAAHDPIRLRHSSSLICRRWHPRKARPFDRGCVNDRACFDQPRSYWPARPGNLVFHRGLPFCCVPPASLCRAEPTPRRRCSLPDIQTRTWQDARWVPGVQGRPFRACGALPFAGFLELHRRDQLGQIVGASECRARIALNGREPYEMLLLHST